jgi:hypothetical protein
VARLCAYGRSLGCTRSDQRHGRLRAAHISLRRSGSSTAVIVTERPFVQRRRCPGLTLLGPGNLESRCSTFGQPPLRGRDRRPSSSSTSSARARSDRRIIAAETWRYAIEVCASARATEACSSAMPRRPWRSSRCLTLNSARWSRLCRVSRTTSSNSSGPPSVRTPRRFLESELRGRAVPSFAAE